MNTLDFQAGKCMRNNTIIIRLMLNIWARREIEIKQQWEREKTEVIDNYRDMCAQFFDSRFMKISCSSPLRVSFDLLSKYVYRSFRWNLSDRLIRSLRCCCAAEENLSIRHSPCEIVNNRMRWESWTELISNCVSCAFIGKLRAIKLFRKQRIRIFIFCRKSQLPTWESEWENNETENVRKCETKLWDIFFSLLRHNSFAGSRVHKVYTCHARSWIIDWLLIYQLRPSSLSSPSILWDCIFFEYFLIERCVCGWISHENLHTPRRVRSWFALNSSSLPVYR